MSEQRALWVSTSTETRGGVATYVLAMQGTPLWVDWNIRHVATHRDGSAATKIVMFARGVVFFAAALIRFRPNVVHLHASADASFVRKAILFWISKLAGRPTIVHMHGSAFPEYVHKSPRLIRVLIRATMRHAAAVVALGNTWAERLQAIEPTARITGIPNAVQLGRPVTQPEPGEPVQVVFLGRIGDHKGTFRLLDAWAALALEFGADWSRHATLTIAGDGDVERARRRIRELHLHDTVDVQEWLSQSAVSKLLDCAHVLVLPSRNEGQPMAVLEAMARGLCVIASDVGGLPEMIGGGCGVLVSPNDVDGIATALRMLLRDRDLRARYGAAAYARVEADYDACVVAKQIDTLYRKVCR